MTMSLFGLPQQDDQLCLFSSQDGQQMLGDEELGKTRSQTRKFSESDEKKPTVKRTSTMAQTAQVCISLKTKNISCFQQGKLLVTSLL